MAPTPRFVVDRFARRAKVARLIHSVQFRRRPPEPLDPEPVPVAPDRPSSLSGGAAAALEYND